MCYEEVLGPSLGEIITVRVGIGASVSVSGSAV